MANVVRVSKRNQVYSQGCQAGSILHRLSWLLAAATRVLTRLSAPSNVARSGISNVLSSTKLIVHTAFAYETIVIN